MVVYLLMLAISCLFCYFSMRCPKGKKKILLQVLSALPFILVSAIRYDVGNDFIGRYTVGYLHILQGGIVSNYEYGFHLLNKLCIFISDSPQTLFILTSIIINGLVFYSIFKNSKNPILSILFYFFGAFFFQSMNGVRQYVAMAMMLIAFPLVEKKKYIPLFVICFLSYYIHNISILVSLVYLAIILINKTKLKEKEFYTSPLLLFGILIFILIFKGFVYDFMISILEHTRFSSYIGSIYDHSDFQCIPFFVNLFTYLYLVLPYNKYKKNKKCSQNEKMYLFLQWIAVIVCFCTIVNTLFLRIAYMFTIFAVISVANCHEKYYNKNDQLRLCTIGLFLVLYASFLWINVIHEVEKGIPYQTVFNKVE